MEHPGHYHDEMRLYPNSSIGATFVNMDGDVVTDYLNTANGSSATISSQ